MALSNRIKINFIFAVAFSLSVLICFATYRNARLLKENSDLVVHTYQVKEALERIASLMKDLETGQRGFIIMGEEAYAEPFVMARKAIDTHFIQLRQLTLDSPLQQRRIEELSQLKDERLVIIEQTIEARKAQGFEAARKIVASDTGLQIMLKFRGLVDEMGAQEDSLLLQRNHASDESSASTNLVILLGGGLGALLLFGALIALNISERRREIADATIKRQTLVRNGLLKLSEEMAGEYHISAFADRVVKTVAEFLHSPMGALYIAEGDILKRMGTFALPLDNSQSVEMKFGTSLVGQAALQAKPLIVRQVPADYFKISSGLGERAPSFLYHYPLILNGRVVGVLEFGTFSELSVAYQEYLEACVDRIAVSLNSAVVREQVSDLLSKTQVQAEELQAQQEELKSYNEELQTQQEELNQANEELQEQRAALEEKTEILERNNVKLESARGELVQKADALESASNYKSEFLANMSHELRTPLNSILLLSRSMSENGEGNLSEAQMESARAIYSSGADLLNLISDILDLSKVEAGKLEVHFEELEIEEVADSLKKTFKSQIEDKKLTFDISISPGCARIISTDRFRLEQILKNFISNSIKFTSNGGVELCFTEGSRSDFIRIAVKDTGIGVPEKMRERIFAAFEQADSSVSRKYGGTGLGLTIARELAILLGGGIQLERSDSTGSVFSVQLPISVEQVSGEDGGNRSPAREKISKIPLTEKLRTPIASTPQVEDDREEISDKDRKILVIEDDVSFAKILAGICRSRGFKALIAVTGEAGIADAKKYRPDAVLLDLKLPGVSGITVLASLKENLHTRHIPVHVISGIDDSNEVMRMGAVGLLHKPVDEKSIEGALSKLEERMSAKGKRILVVEDKKIEREAIRKLIGSGDVTTIGAGDGKEALKLLEEGGFACMVLDLQLPDMTGFELLGEMAKVGSRTPVIVYTGRDLSKDELDRLRMLSKSIIIKGVKSEERLFDEISLFLHRVSSDLPLEKQQMLERVRHREEVFEGKKILIVDDDMRNIFALRSVLQDRGLEILVARTGVEAIKKVEENPDMDAVLMDVMMPEMSGLEATTRIRQQPQFQSLPIVALTAKAMAGDREKCLAAGCNDYLSKPIDADSLLSILRIWLMRKLG